MTAVKEIMAFLRRNTDNGLPRPSNDAQCIMAAVGYAGDRIAEAIEANTKAHTNNGIVLARAWAI